MANILSIDIGYGDSKCIFGDDLGNIKKKFKIPTVIGVVSNHSDLVKDERIITYQGNSFYVGEDAYALESDKIIDIVRYDQLEFYAPLIVYYVGKLIGYPIDILVTGLSKAQYGNSGHFKKKLESFVCDNREITFNQVHVLPQGVPSKLALEKYGINYPKENTEFLDKKSYVCVDIGFNTLDIFQVINGQSSAHLAEGIEGLGLMKIASEVKNFIKEDQRFHRDIPLKEAKLILDTNTYHLRGVSYDLSDEINQLKEKYLLEIQNLVEKRYGAILDKMSGFYIIGGGSIIFRNMNNQFIKVPYTENEFYNALGFYLRYAGK